MAVFMTNLSTYHYVQKNPLIKNAPDFVTLTEVKPLDLPPDSG